MILVVRSLGQGKGAVFCHLYAGAGLPKIAGRTLRGRAAKRDRIIIIPTDPNRNRHPPSPGQRLPRSHPCHLWAGSVGASRSVASSMISVTVVKPSFSACNC